MVVKGLKDYLNEFYNVNKIIESITPEYNVSEYNVDRVQNLIKNELTIKFFDKQKNPNYKTYFYYYKNKDSFMIFTNVDCKLNINHYNNQNIYIYINNFENINPILLKLLNIHNHFLTNLKNFTNINTVFNNSFVKVNDNLIKLSKSLSKREFFNKDFGHKDYKQFKLSEYEIVILFKEIKQKKAHKYVINNEDLLLLFKNPSKFQYNFNIIKEFFDWLNKNAVKTYSKVLPRHGTISSSIVNKEFKESIINEYELEQQEVYVSNLHFLGKMVFLFDDNYNNIDYYHILGLNKNHDNDNYEEENEFNEFNEYDSENNEYNINENNDDDSLIKNVITLETLKKKIKEVAEINLKYTETVTSLEKNPIQIISNKSLKKRNNNLNNKEKSLNTNNKEIKSNKKKINENFNNNSDDNNSNSSDEGEDNDSDDDVEEDFENDTEINNTDEEKENNLVSDIDSEEEKPTTSKKALKKLKQKK